MTAATLITVDEAGAALGVSRATVWRMIRRRELTSVRQRGRRLIPASALRSQVRRRPLRPLAPSHPMAAFIGIGHGGGRVPGASDKHAVLDC